MYSESYETYVVAANMMGKDYVAGFIAVHAFLTNRVARIITTSVKDDHLRVLWGEINEFIGSSEIPLTFEQGGPFIVNHREIKKQYGGIECPKSYMKGMVSLRGEGLAGHHAPYTLAIIDEASGVVDDAYKKMSGWADRFLIFGNPYPTKNFFYQGIKAGDLLVSNGASVLQKGDTDSSGGLAERAVRSSSNRGRT